MDGIIYANIAASAAAAAVLIFRRFFKDKVFSLVFVLLWAAIIIRFLLPFEFSSAISLYPIESETKSTYSEVNVRVPAEQIIIPQETETANPAPAEKTETQKTEISFADILPAVWISGAALCGAFFAVKHILSVRKIMSTAFPFEEKPEGLKDSSIRLYKNKILCSPLSFGFLRPAIVLPEDILPEQLPFVLLHEQTHIKNRDAFIKLIGIFALCLNWFNPFAWLTVKYLDRDLERYCDEKVLSSIGKEKAAGYANTILDFAERESFSLSFFSAAPLSERIASIMKNNNKKAHLPAVLCVFMAMIILMTACGTVPKEPEVKNDYEELAEILKNADWQFSMEDQYVLDLGMGNLDSYVYKITDDNGKEHFSYSCNFTSLPVERIIIKDLGIADYIPSQIHCFKTHSESIGISNYDKLLNCGFKVEYNDGEIVISTEKPIEGKVPEFSLNIHVNLEETDIISESVEVFYFGMPNKNEEYSREKHAKEISFLDEPDSYQEFVYVAETPNADKTPVEIRDENNRKEALETEISFTWPCSETDINSAFGERESHPGIDIGHEHGSAVYAAADGEVFMVDDDFPIYGKSIAIDNGDSFSTFYGNCSEIYVEQFDKVKAGDLIARTGSTGNSTGPHLHFELRKGKTQLDPEDFLPLPVPYEEPQIDENPEIDMEFIRPIKGGYVSCPLWGWKGHVGADYTPENGKGSEIFAVADGKVVKSKRSNAGYGNQIVIDHGNGIQTLYAHCHELFVNVGNEVKAGDVIASVGSTGNSTGTHLHFELRQNGIYVDPEKYIPEA